MSSDYKLNFCTALVELPIDNWNSSGTNPKMSSQIEVLILGVENSGDLILAMFCCKAAERLSHVAGNSYSSAK